MKPRSKTPEECREDFQRHMLMLCRYWADVPRREGNETEVGRMEGLCHSIQAYLDGRTTASCGIDLVLRPCEGDKEYLTERGENWQEDGMVINDVSLTETFFRVKEKYYGNKHG